VVDIAWLLMGTGMVIFIMGFVFMFDKTLLKAGLPLQNTEGSEELKKSKP
jgi:hypothetical protein